MKWKYFVGAAIIVGCALLKIGAPIVPILLGIALAVLLNLRQQANAAKANLKHP